MTEHVGTQREAPATPSLPESAAKFAPELAQLFVVMLWASTFIVTKAAFAEVSPLGFIFSRFLLMIALAFVVLAIKERGENGWIARAERSWASQRQSRAGPVWAWPSLASRSFSSTDGAPRERYWEIC